MVAPGLTGWDTLRMLAEDDALALPILSHPAWLGTFAISPEQGVAHHVIFGQLPRLAGADATIFVNHGGRFAFTRDDCRGIVAATEQPMGQLRPIFPIPAGGMTLDRLPEMAEFYGQRGRFSDRRRALQPRPGPGGEQPRVSPVDRTDKEVRREAG